MNIAALLFDLGDVIMQEETEVKDAEWNTLHADLVDGMDDALRALKARGYKIALVADTRPKTAWNVLHQHDLYDLFDACAISEEVGCEKPDPRLFRAALDALEIAPRDYARTVMIGNRLARDVRGANNLGVISVWFHWNERYAAREVDSGDQPTFQVQTARELLELIERVESELANK
ncbi:MAG: HAD family hydrolase [Anaerolineales bacterium]|nr:HAD family hydrolase [Anaerolineales bacterium]